MSFQVDLEIYHGPLELLVFLVRRHELEVESIPLLPITEQFFAYLEQLPRADVSLAGEFVDLASSLIELKARSVVPQVEETVESPAEDPREDLVTRLLHYKRYRDAASALEERSRQWQQRMPRLVDDGQTLGDDAADRPLEELAIFDLVSAWQRMIAERVGAPTANIVYDETPIHVYMQRIWTSLHHSPAMAFSEFLQPGISKSALIGLFLAILELVRHQRIIAEQSLEHSEIWLRRGPRFDAPPESDTN